MTETIVLSEWELTERRRARRDHIARLHKRMWVYVGMGTAVVCSVGMLVGIFAFMWMGDGVGGKPDVGMGWGAWTLIVPVVILGVLIVLVAVGIAWERVSDAVARRW